MVLVHTEDKNWYVHMYNLARQMGLRECQPFSNKTLSLTRYRRGPMPFILLHSNTTESKLIEAVASVRAHNELILRFLPIIMISEETGSQNVLKYIQMGCDDIVLHPCTAATLAARFAQQLDRPIDFYQTETYFGPDRRTRELLDKRKVKNQGLRGSGEHFFRLFVIQRHASRGTSIQSTQACLPNNYGATRA